MPPLYHNYHHFSCSFCNHIMWESSISGCIKLSRIYGYTYRDLTHTHWFMVLAVHYLYLYIYFSILMLVLHPISENVYIHFVSVYSTHTKIENIVSIERFIYVLFTVYGWCMRAWKVLIYFIVSTHYTAA